MRPCGLKQRVISDKILRWSQEVAIMIEKPEPPGDYECCESGCDLCVWDIYRMEMDRWRAAQAERSQSTPTSESPSEQAS